MAVMFNRLKSPSVPAGNSYALADAGSLALKLAETERLPLAYVARHQPPNAEHWFAASILSVVGGEGLRGNETSRRALVRTDLDGLTLSDDMSKLTLADNPEPVSTDLRVSRAEFDRYMRWARTVL